MTMITLSAGARYGYGGKQFIARIVGRDAKFTFAREFVGRKGGKRGESSTADVDEPGLYETRDVGAKGNTDDRYCLILPHGGGLALQWIDKEGAMKVAREIQSGRDVTRCAEHLPADPLLKEAVDEKERLQRRLSDYALTTANLHDPEGFVSLGDDTGPWKAGAEAVRRRAFVEYITDRVAELDALAARLTAEGRRAKSEWRFVSAADEEAAAEEEAAKEAGEKAADESAARGLEAAYAALKGLPEKEVKKALTELRRRLLAKEGVPV